MSYYHTCPRCGSNLDPGEVCTDCQEKEMTKRPNLLRVSQELTAYEDPDRVLAALGAMLGKEPLPEGQTNNEKFNTLLNRCGHPRDVHHMLLALGKKKTPADAADTDEGQGGTR